MVCTTYTTLHTQHTVKHKRKFDGLRILYTTAYAQKLYFQMMRVVRKYTHTFTFIGTSIMCQNKFNSLYLVIGLVNAAINDVIIKRFMFFSIIVHSYFYVYLNVCILYIYLPIYKSYMEAKIRKGFLNTLYKL